MSMDEGVRHINEIIRQIQKRFVLPMRLLDVARMIEDSFPQNASSDGIHFDRPRGTEWLNGVFQRHNNVLESDLVKAGEFTLVLPRCLPSSRLGQLLIAWEEESILEKARGVAGKKQVAGLDTHGEERGGVFHTPEVSGILGSDSGQLEESRRPCRNEQSQVSGTSERSGP